MPSKPSPAILNAAAAVALWGDTLDHTASATRFAAVYEFGLIVHNYEMPSIEQILAGARFQPYKVAAGAMEQIEAAPLWKAAQHLIGKGFHRAPGRHKPGFVRFIRIAGVRTETAWISAGRYVFEREEGSRGAAMTLDTGAARSRQPLAA